MPHKEKMLRCNEREAKPVRGVKGQISGAARGRKMEAMAVDQAVTAH